MPDRREFVVGALGLGALGSAEWLRPRRTIRLFGSTDLTATVPLQFGRWKEHPGGNVVAPTTPNSLADRLYSATVTRVYVSQWPDDPPVMLLVAYGGEQSDLLQLHRPETCYPAVGLEIVKRNLSTMSLGAGIDPLPVTMLSAGSPERREDIVYWTRLGEAFPRSGSEQRSSRLKAAMGGVIGDGILVRASCAGSGDTAETWPYLQAFLRGMVGGIAPSLRKGFIGSERASQIA